MADELKDEDDLSMPNFPPTDETGDVDLSLLDSTLRLTPAQRAERHYHARLFAQRLRRLARERYGSTLDDLEGKLRQLNLPFDEPKTKKPDSDRFPNPPA